MKNAIKLCGLLACAACTFPFPGQASIASPAIIAPTGIVVTATPSAAAVLMTAPELPSWTAVPTLMPSPVLATPTTVLAVVVAPSATPVVEPVGCQRPPDDYARVLVNGAKLNKRTLWMLRHAKTLTKGTIDFSGSAITQGSYNPGGVAASFGTHDGGGAVDISVIRRGVILRHELPDVIRALRIAGFAAWVRETSELYNGSPIHIHAIAIGDVDLSPIARDQLTGPFGYFRGYNGLPKKDNNFVPDRHGGPILCRWMVDMGYQDLR